MNIPCFFLRPTGRQAIYLRRYKSGANTCPVKGYHDRMLLIGEGTIRRTPDGYIDLPEMPQPPREDPRWPLTCACGYSFLESDNWQLFAKTLYVRSDNGQETTIADAPAGALWHAEYLEGHYPSPDGKIVMCKTPGGEWNIDSRASNCTRPDDKAHNCWCRHGDPTDPQGLKTGVPFHVDKNGDTCAAGAGSIVCGNYHGFLHGGMLTGL